MTKRKILIALTAMIFFASCGKPSPINTPTPESTKTPTVTPSPQPTLTPSATPLADLGIVVKVVEKNINDTEITLKGKNLIPLTNAIPIEWLAVDESLAGYEISIEPLPINVNKCKYVPTDNTFGYIYFRQVNVDVDIKIKNLTEDKIIATNQFKGTQPPDCPSSIVLGEDSTLGLGLPNTYEFKNWIINAILSNTKLPAPASGVNSLAFSLDGKTLAFASEDNIVKFLDVSNLDNSMNLIGHTSRINNIAFSPDGSTIVSASEDGTAKLWDTTTALTLRTFIIDKTNTEIGFSSDGNVLLLSVANVDKNNQYIEFWDMENLGKNFGVIPYDYAVLTPDRKNYIGIFDTNLIVRDMSKVNGGPWRYDRDLVIFRYEGNVPLRNMTFSQDGKTLAFTEIGRNYLGEETNRVNFFNTETWEKTLTISDVGNIDNIALSPDRKILAAQNLDSVIFWDTLSGKESLSIYGSQFTSIVFSPDGKMLVTGSQTGMIEFWDTRNGTLLFQFKNMYLVH